MKLQFFTSTEDRLRVCFFVSLFLPSVFSRLAHLSVISFLDDVCSFQGTFLWVVS